MRWSNISVLSVAGKEGWETALDDLLMRSARLLLSRPLSFPPAPCPSFFSFLLLFSCFFWALFPVFGTILTLSFPFSLFSSLASTLFLSFSCPFLSSISLSLSFHPAFHLLRVYFLFLNLHFILKNSRSSHSLRVLLLLLLPHFFFPFLLPYPFSFGLAFYSFTPLVLAISLCPFFADNYRYLDTYITRVE